MYIVAIAWVYVLLLVSIMQPSVFRGIVTFVGAGLLPLALLLYLMGTPQRRRDRARAEAQSLPPDISTDAELTEARLDTRPIEVADPARDDEAPTIGAQPVNPADPAK